MFQFCILCIALILPAVLGGGTISQPLFLSATLLCAGSLWICVRERVAPDRAQQLVLATTTLAILWLAFTIVPLPDAAIESLGAARKQLVADTLETRTLAQAAGIDWPTPLNYCISMNRAGTMRIILLVIAMASAAHLASSLPSQYRRYLLYTLIGMGTVVAISGIIETKIPPIRKIWWWMGRPPDGGLACFVNPNHYGGLLAMMCPGTIAMCVVDIQKREWERLVLWASIQAILITGVMVSQSRGAYVVLVASLIVSGVLFTRRKTAAVGIGLAAFACMGLVLVAVLETPAMELELQTIKEVGLTGRTDIWRQSAAAWSDFPLLGLGAEGFRTVSTKYELQQTAFYAHHAESTYMQLLADGGIVGYLLIAVLLMGYIRCVRSRQHGIGSIEKMAGLGACAVVALHGFFDFPIHVPLYGLVAATFCGFLVAVPGREPQTGDRRSLVTLLPALGVALVVGMWLQYGKQIYERDKFRYAEDASNEELIANIRWAPMYWATWYHLGRQALNTRDWEHYALAHACLSQASALYPYHDELQLTLKRVQRVSERRQQQLDAARKFNIPTHRTVPEPPKP